VSAGLKNWPDSVQELTKPVPCTGAAEATIAGDLIGIDSKSWRVACSFGV